MSGVYPLDWWSVPHVASGMALAAIGLGVWWALTALAGFEVLEFFLRFVPAGGGPLFEYESLSNILADVLVGLVGYVAVVWLLHRGHIRLPWARLLPRRIRRVDA